MPRDPWYTVATDDELNQGDLINDCPVILPKTGPLQEVQQPRSGEDAIKEIAGPRPYELIKKNADIVVLTQSCDLTNQKAALILVCPHYSLVEIANALNTEVLGRPTRQQLTDKLRSQTQNIRAGKTVGRYMLAPCSLKRWKRGIRIVDFERTFSVPYDYLRVIARNERKRLRIKSPYREHLSQAFAVFFMRVALDAVVSKDTLNAEVDELLGDLI